MKWMFKHKQFLIRTALLIVCAFALFSVGADVALAQQGDVFGVTDIQRNTQLGSGDIRVTVARIINVFLGILGIVAFALVVFLLLPLRSLSSVGYNRRSLIKPELMKSIRRQGTVPILGIVLLCLVAADQLMRNVCEKIIFLSYKVFLRIPHRLMVILV